jgi:hypothetical protein
VDELKRVDPNVIIPLASTERRVEEVVVIQRESSAGWWAVGILCALALVVVVWLLTRPAETAATALVQNRVSGARDSVAIAQAEAMEARAEAVRATQQARTAEALAASGRAPVEQPSAGVAVVTSTSPQP